MRKSLFIAILAGMALVTSAVSALAAAHETWSHDATERECMSDATAAMAVANLTNIHRDTSAVWGEAGEYFVVAGCDDNAASLTVAGPSEQVASALFDRIKDRWD